MKVLLSVKKNASSCIHWPIVDVITCSVLVYHACVLMCQTIGDIMILLWSFCGWMRNDFSNLVSMGAAQQGQPPQWHTNERSHSIISPHAPLRTAPSTHTNTQNQCFIIHKHPSKRFNNLLSLIWSFFFSLNVDFQSCLICVARRVPMKERPMLPTHESFTTRQDLQGNHTNATPLSAYTLQRVFTSRLAHISMHSPCLKQQILTLPCKDCV